MTLSQKRISKREAGRSHSKVTYSPGDRRSGERPASLPRGFMRQSQMEYGPRAQWRWWGWLLAGLGCGALIGLSVPPFGWWPLAWLGFAGIAFLLPGQPVRPRILLGLGTGAG